MRPLFPKLRFADLAEAQQALKGRFPDWDPNNASPQTNEETMECLVQVQQNVQLDENDEPLPTSWTGVHVDLSLQSEAPDLEEFWVVPEPQNPDHSFGEEL
ncbi:MAG: hypothetical protein EP346_00120 [Bacteroidetes bacterium]|nr:MAG: hypothetical protein EP346_00120 [Bacteroidota bacterium]